MKRLYLISVLDTILATALLYAFGSDNLPLLPLAGLAMLIRPWIVLYRLDSPYSHVFNPDSPDGGAFLKEMALIAENAKAEKKPTSILLTPLFTEKGFIPYELSYDSKTSHLLISIDGKTSKKKVKSSFSPKTQMPIVVFKDPVRIDLEVTSLGRINITRPGPLVRPNHKRAKHYGTNRILMEVYLIILVILYGATSKGESFTPLRLGALAIFPVVFHKLYALRFRIAKFSTENFDFLLRLLRIRG